MNAKNWGVFESLGELIAASGPSAAAFNHRSTELRTKLREAAQDVEISWPIYTGTPR